MVMYRLYDFPGLVIVVALVLGCGSDSPDDPSPDAAVVEAPACANNPAYVANPATGHRYRAVAEGTDISWTDARAVCQSDEADLVIIEDGNENAYVFDLLQVTMWIGLVRVGPGELFEWVDGRPITYQNWADPEPNNFSGMEDRAEITAPGAQWSDVADDDQNPGFVCECFIPTGAL